LRNFVGSVSNRRKDEKRMGEEGRKGGGKSRGATPSRAIKSRKRDRSMEEWKKRAATGGCKEPWFPQECKKTWRKVPAKRGRPQKTAASYSIFLVARAGMHAEKRKKKEGTRRGLTKMIEPRNPTDRKRQEKKMKGEDGICRSAIAADCNEVEKKKNQGIELGKHR